MIEVYLPDEDDWLVYIGGPIHDVEEVSDEIIANYYS